MSFRVESFGNAGDAESWLTLRLSPQLKNACDRIRFAVSHPERLPTFAASVLSPLSIPGGAQFQNHDGLLKLGNGTEHLADKGSGRVIASTGQVCTVSREHSRADPRELVDDHLPNHQVAGQAIGALHNDDPDAVGFDTIEKRRETRTVYEFLRSTYPLVAVLLDEVVAGGGREPADRVALPLESIPVDLTASAYAQIRDGCRFCAHSLKSLLQLARCQQ